VSAPAIWKRCPLALRQALPAWILARILVLAGMGAAKFVVDEYPLSALARRSFVTLVPWDGLQYEVIVRFGYAPDPDLYRFFPLYPLAARVLDAVTPGGADVALVVLANLCSLAFVVLLYQLVQQETGDADLARRAAWFGCLAPGAFVMVWGYSEALFLLLSVCTFTALRRERFVVAAAFGALAALARPLGMLVALPAAVEGWRGFRQAGARGRAERLLAVAGPPLGALVYLLWVRGQTGDLLEPYRIQGSRAFRGSSVDPVTGIWSALTQFFDHDRIGPLLHVGWAVVAIALVVVALRRLPLSYGLFAGAIVLVALSSRKLDSFERYAFGAFPLVIAAAQVVRTRRVETLVFAAAGGAICLYTTVAMLGVYLP
jgi:hypothetical protein